jgi:nucleoside-diphosphate-sugar epimerase
MDTAKARRELGWEPCFDAEETLIQTAISAREAGLLK